MFTVKLLEESLVEEVLINNRECLDDLKMGSVEKWWRNLFPDRQSSIRINYYFAINYTRRRSHTR